ncbi:hypothetical protein BJY52DRAFT_1216965 [Lactarius psammicola]|nr:hypothetical protein BJY52DRAFT_1216965 [Lactarius psammicola]
MSQKIPLTASSPSNFRATFYAALKTYKDKTKKDLLAHPLMAQLQTCNSPTDILAILRTQVQQFEQSTHDDDKLTRWLNPTINVLYAFSAVLGEGVGLVFSPAKVIFTGTGVLLLAAKDVIASQDALINVFEGDSDVITKIMVEVLGILGVVTKEMKQGRAKKYLKKLVGRRDIEDALSRLDKLTQQEVQMAIVEVLKVAHHVKDGVETVGNKVNVAIEDGKETKALVQQTANNIDKEKCS